MGRLQRSHTERGAEHCACAIWWWLVAIPNSHFVDPMLFLKTNGLAKGSSMVVVMVEDAVVAERPPNMRIRSSTFRYGGFANLVDRSATVR